MLKIRSRARRRAWRRAAWLPAVLIGLLGSAGAGAAERPAPTPDVLPLVPWPASVQPSAGAFQLTASTPLAVPAGDPGARTAAEYFADLAARTRGLLLSVEAPAAEPAVRFERVADLGPEAYRLEVTPAGIRIAATTDAGLFYGAVTLWQLVPAGKGPVAIGSVAIADQPVYAWRGLMLDSARHMQSPAFIKTLLDGMALHKLNVLHWHLTDDQGWRLEIRRYPKLTSVGGYRVPAGRGAARDIDPATRAPRLYGGYYSQSTVRDIVAYARSRQITIVPEIEMPGHASAAIAAYPELGVVPMAKGVPADWGVYPHVYNVSEATCQFLEHVLAEVIELFPGRLVHVGGDEVVRSEWEASPEVRARIAELGLPGPGAIHGYLVQRMGRFLASHDRRLAGWDEILEPGLSTEATVLSWRGLAGALVAAKRGNDTVLTPDPGLYFDHRQGTGPDEPPGRIATLSLGEVYAFDPLPAGLTDAERRHVLGLQANVWTEHIRTDARVAYAIFPRAAALAEVGWTARERRAWPDFRRRVASSLDRYRILGLPYSGDEFNVRATPAYSRATSVFTVTLATPSPDDVIRYTTDGIEPTPTSLVYHVPLTVRSPGVLRAATFLGDTRVSAVSRFELDARFSRRRTSAELELCTNGVALALELDDVPGAPRKVVNLDILNPCWIYRGATLGPKTTLAASVGPVPYNYQIGAAEKSIRVGDATTPAGELEVRLDTCEGRLLASLPLAPAANRLGATLLPAATLPGTPGVHDLCFRFRRPALDPIWALESVDLGGFVDPWPGRW